jgi:polyvinyl alcohol dehydrogenase (cytochrome)
VASKPISFYTDIADDWSRTTPAVADDVIIIGNQGGRVLGGAGGNNVAKVIAVNKNDLSEAWEAVVDSHRWAVVTAAPVIHGGVVYVGVASLQEGTQNPAEDFDFIGSAVALDLDTGAQIWKTYTAPERPAGWDVAIDGPWYSGNAIWSTAPAVDEKRGYLYVTTGNNYTIPDAVLTCLQNAVTDPISLANAEDPSLQEREDAIDDAIENCYGNDFNNNWFDAVVALNLATGERVWVRHTLPFDAWTGFCFAPPFPGNPCQGGPDYDFGQGPSLFSTGKNRSQKDILGVGQKSGDYWGLDPDTGDILWQTKVSPGSAFAGGLQWGSAADGKYIYTVSNTALDAGFAPKQWELKGNKSLDKGDVVNYGFYSGIQGTNGQIRWQTKDLNQSGAIGRVSVANGVVYVGSLGTPAFAGGAANDPTMIALDAGNGDVLWEFASGGSVISGAVIVDGVVYWGSGYGQFGQGTNNTTLYAFSIGGN